jgi:hypothetical protein
VLPNVLVVAHVGEFVVADSPGLEACVENELQKCPHLLAGVEREVNPTLLHEINQLFDVFALMHLLK